MSIKQRLETDMKQAMKGRDRPRVSCIRMLKSKLLEHEVSLRAKHGTDYEISDEEAQVVIATYAKQRRDSIDSYRSGGRDDLVADEQAELEIVTTYLPRQLSEDELRQLVLVAISESGAESIKDIGKLMKVLMPKTKGKADGKQVNRIVRELLGVS